MMILDCLWRNVFPLLFTQLTKYTWQPQHTLQPEDVRPNETLASLDGPLPEIALAQYRFVDARIEINRYGPILPGDHQNRSWNLLSQDSTLVPSFLEKAKWDCEAFLEEDRAFFLGSIPDPLWDLQIGFQGEDFMFGAGTPDDIRGVLSRSIQSGRFSTSHELVIMIEERKMADHTVFRIRSFEEGVFRIPDFANDMWTTPPSVISFPYKSTGNGPSDIHVSISYDSGDQSLIWTLTSWAARFGEQISLKIIESQTPAPPDVTLLDGDNLIRAFYGASPNSTAFKLETVQMRSFGSTNSPEVEILSSQTFPIMWNASSRYISFSLSQSTTGRGSSMVVLLEDPETAALSTLVFPRGPKNDFLPPTVKPVKIPEGVPTVTAPFLKTLRVQQTSYISRETGARAQGGLLQLFDDFGTLGARLLAPTLEDDGLSYEVVSQNPALTGHSSDVIGWRFREV